MNKVACLTTGGTIVSQDHGRGLMPNGNHLMNDRISNILYKDVDVIQVCEKDSSDIGVSEYVSIALKIQEIYDHYKGFIIVHGTDTMAYTAAQLSYMLHGLDKAVVLTGSMLPIEDPQTDAIGNLANAKKSVLDGGLAGVYISFSDKLLLGNKASKINTSSFNAFDSLNFPAVGKFARNGLKIDSGVLDSVKDCQNKTSEVLNFYTKINDKVILLDVIPGMSEKFLEYFIDSAIESDIDAIYIKGFGDGNVPTSGGFQRVIQRCIDAGIMIMLGSQCLTGDLTHKYQGGKYLMDMGCLSGNGLTHESAIGKLRWGMSSFPTASSRRNPLTGDVNGDLLQMKKEIERL